MKALLLFPLTVLIASLALPQAATPAAAKKTAPRHAAAKTTSAKTTSAKKGKATKKSVKTAAAPSRQMTPTAERYRDIQQALADKGYLKSEPSGVWDAQSVEAMRQFQTDQKLTATGKITSASLISLGLGPKNDSAETTATPSPNAQPDNQAATPRP